MSQASSGFDFSPWAALGGGALSSIGSIIGSQDANRNYDDAVEEKQKNNSYAEHLTGYNLFGPAYSAFTAKLYDAIRAAQSGDLTKLNALSSSPEYQAYQKASGGPVVGQLNTLADQFTKSGDQQLGRYDSETNQLNQAGGALSAGIDNWGAGRASIINQDASRSLRNTNDQTMARMNATGLGASTAVTNGLAANARENELNKQRSLQTLSEGQIDRRTAQGNTNLGLLSNRLQGRSTLWGSLQDRNLNLRMAPIYAQQQGIGQTASMYGNMPFMQNTAPSAAGSGLSNIGNALAQYGSLGLLARGGYGNQGNGSGSSAANSSSYYNP